MQKKVIDHLWTARWAVKNNKNQAAFDEITEALIDLGALKSPLSIEPDRPNEVMPDDFEADFVEPKFVTVRGVRFKDRGNYRTASGKFKGLVVHYTVSGRTEKSAQAVVSYLASKGLGCMVMSETGKIYIPEGFDPLSSWGYHAGISKWNGTTGLSDQFAGMEICSWGRGSKVGPFRSTKGEANMIEGTYQAFTEAQELALINFVKWALARNPEFTVDNICGHDEARTAAGKHGDKQDPGASLSVSMPDFRAMLKR